MQTISNYDFKNKKALIRVDFNVPLNENFEITDDTRMTAAVPTIKKVMESGGSSIIMSHFGRPKYGPEDKYSMRHLVNHLSGLLGKEVKLAPDCIGDKVKEMAAALKPGEALLLENLRFHKEEEGGDESFAGKLAELGNCWINDAFGTAHRAHASTAVIAKFFPNDKMFGYLVESEIKSIDKVMANPVRPMTAIMGGAKISTKITIIENMLNKVDNLIIGGGMIFTFVKAMGGDIGASLCENDYLELAKTIIKKAKEKSVNLIIASDCLAADKFANDANIEICPTSNIKDGWMGLDVGPETIKIFKEVIGSSKTILWNGPAGVFEMDTFSAGTKAIGDAVAKSTKEGAFSLVGGGDSVAAVNKFGMADDVSYISTAGGALLEYLEGKALPGIAAIRE
ncbi:MAG: phosphoglycerate kinase [Bacteroidales bacterium]|jgi:phosphoglycerate kinase|nr:phosphoglycerate kinase [Bacteroidales bacterium]